MKAPQEPIARLALSTDETAAALGVSRSTVYNLMRSGDLKFIMVRGRRLTPVAEIQALLNRLGTVA